MSTAAQARATLPPLVISAAQNAACLSGVNFAIRRLNTQVKASCAPLPLAPCPASQHITHRASRHVEPPRYPPCAPTIVSQDKDHRNFAVGVHRSRMVLANPTTFAVCGFLRVHGGQVKPVKNCTLRFGQGPDAPLQGPRSMLQQNPPVRGFLIWSSGRASGELLQVAPWSSLEHGAPPIRKNQRAPNAQETANT